MAPTEKECIEMVEAAKNNNIILAFGHVMRYTNEYMTVKKLIDDGAIGEKKVFFSTFYFIGTAQKMKFFIKGFFSKCDQIRSFRRICSHLLKKSLMQNFIFCAVRFVLNPVKHP